MSRYGDFKQRHADGIWQSLNRLMLILIVFAAITAAVCMFLPELKTLHSQSDRVEQLKAELEKENFELDRNTREVKLLKNDPEYIETVARDRLEAMKPGETIFRLETPHSAAR